MGKLLLLVNYGGPECDPKSAEEYLKNLFSDPLLFPLPSPLRKLFATLLAKRRRKETLQILKAIGCKSPLKEQTALQAKALVRKLPGWEVRYAMRYSPPYIGRALKDADKFETVKVLPLFPHYSVSTWGTTIKEVEKHLPKGDFSAAKPFYDCPQFITGWVEAVLAQLKGLKNPFLLFSAHSLPLYLVRHHRDPYPDQVEKSAQLIADELNLPHLVGYQSAFGPLRWLSPSTEEVIKNLASQGVKELVVIPISFVSENSETLQEIDITYRKLAEKEGIEKFVRVKIPFNSPRWIECFASAALF